MSLSKRLLERITLPFSTLYFLKSQILFVIFCLLNLGEVLTKSDKEYTGVRIRNCLKKSLLVSDFFETKTPDFKAFKGFKSGVLSKVMSDFRLLTKPLEENEENLGVFFLYKDERSSSLYKDDPKLERLTLRIKTHHELFDLLGGITSEVFDFLFEIRFFFFFVVLKSHLVEVDIFFGFGFSKEEREKPLLFTKKKMDWKPSSKQSLV